MDNYEHEIVCPDNKEILNYLWYDHGLSFWKNGQTARETVQMMKGGADE
jgi:hypothetical protein